MKIQHHLNRHSNAREDIHVMKTFITMGYPVAAGYDVQLGSCF
jgi:hypothetical protein